MAQTPEDIAPVTPTSAKNSAQPPASRAKAARERATSVEPQATRRPRSSSESSSVAASAPSVAASIPPTRSSSRAPSTSASAAAASASAASVGTAPSRRLALPIMAALVVGAVLGGASGAGIAVLITQDSTEQTAAVNPQQSVVINNASAVTDISAVAAKASPSVVTIKVSTATSGGSGSGVIISNDGYIVTNAHVVTLSGATNEATWQVEDNRGLLFSAKLVGTDPTVDLAVLKVDGVTDWTPIEWADSSKLNVGDVTIAMGAPLGLDGTVTTGIVSALNRSIQIGNSAVPDQSDSTTPDQDNPFDFFQFDYGQGQGQTQSSQASITIPVIQTDAAINRGNSGGALLDSQGRLIGVNVAIAGSGGNIGVGFALPSNLVKRVTSEIIDTGSATHGLLGASVSDQASQKGSTSVGAVVKEVVAGSAADKAGIQAGDIVMSVNGVPIESSSDLTATIRSLAAGTTTDLVIVRGGKPQTITVTLGTFK